MSNFRTCTCTGELPVTVDFDRYDRSPGLHNITVIANSTSGVMDDYTYEFYVQGRDPKLHVQTMNNHNLIIGGKF